MRALHPELDRVVAEIRAARAPAGASTRIVAVDGPGGAGKSTLANHIARELAAPVVRTDDFASWDNPLDWWPHVLEMVLIPLVNGRPASYTPTTWGGPPRQVVVVEPGEFVLLEGVSASRAAFRPYLAYSIWVETPKELRLRRGLERDGESALGSWERWMDEEDAWVARELPADHADVILSGSDDHWS
jgi:uridine kinase